MSTSAPNATPKRRNHVLIFAVSAVVTLAVGTLAFIYSRPP